MVAMVKTRWLERRKPESALRRHLPLVFLLFPPLLFRAGPSMLLDEPLAALDKEAARKHKARIDGVAAPGPAYLIIVTHDQEDSLSFFSFLGDGLGSVSKRWPTRDELYEAPLRAVSPLFLLLPNLFEERIPAERERHGLPIENAGSQAQCLSPRAQPVAKTNVSFSSSPPPPLNCRAVAGVGRGQTRMRSTGWRG